MDLGARFGRYRIERLLGKGGMGSVFLASEDGLERPVVVKIMNADGANDPVAVARLAREAKAAAQVDSEHVVRVFESGVCAGTPFIAMEFVDGSSLHGILEQRGRLPHDEATRLVLEAARGLRDVHAKGILHRDVKPGNILVAKADDGSAGRVKLADFGICKLTSKATQTATATLSTIGEVMGSPDFMSPEQAQEEPLDGRADLYSLGVTYYQLLTGELPFRADSALATLARALNTTPRSPRELVPEIPRGVERVCMALMARDKAARPADAEAAIALLERVARRPSRHVLHAAAVLAFGLFVGVAAGLLASRSAEARPVASVRPERGPAGPEAKDAAHRVPFVRREASQVRAVARGVRDPAVARALAVEAEYLDACDAVRRALVGALAVQDASHLAGALDPLARVAEPPPASIARDLEETKLAFQSTVALIRLLASSGAFGRHHEAHVARLEASSSDDECAALLLLASVHHRPVPRALALRGEAQARPLLAALRLERPRTPSESMPSRPLRKVFGPR